MHLPGLKEEEEVSEEEETAGKTYSLVGVQGDWEIHHFSSAVGATWRGTKRYWSDAGELELHASGLTSVTASIIFCLVLASSSAWLLFNHSQM